MIVPSTLERATLGFKLAVDRLLVMRAPNGLRVKNLQEAEVASMHGERMILQIDDALALVLSKAGFTQADIKRRRISTNGFATPWRRQFKQIVQVISARRIRDASPKERRELAFIQAYARAALSNCNTRPNGLSAAVDSLRSVDRVTGCAGEFAAEIEHWGDWDRKQRRLTKLRRRVKQIEAEIIRLAA